MNITIRLGERCGQETAHVLGGRARRRQPRRPARQQHVRRSHQHARHACRTDETPRPAAATPDRRVGWPRNLSASGPLPPPRSPRSWLTSATSIANATLATFALNVPIRHHSSSTSAYFECITTAGIPRARGPRPSSVDTEHGPRRMNGSPRRRHDDFHVDARRCAPPGAPRAGRRWKEVRVRQPDALARRRDGLQVAARARCSLARARR